MDGQGPCMPGLRSDRLVSQPSIHAYSPQATHRGQTDSRQPYLLLPLVNKQCAFLSFLQNMLQLSSYIWGATPTIFFKLLLKILFLLRLKRESANVHICSCLAPIYHTRCSVQMVATQLSFLYAVNFNCGKRSIVKGARKQYSRKHIFRSYQKIIERK